MRGKLIEVYHDIFENWASVQEQFKMDEPEPDEVFLAAYEYEDYSGKAAVFYRRGELYYEAGGSHCSCYGLEDQWGPEQYDRETFIAMLRKRAAGPHRDPEAKFVLKRLLGADNDNALQTEAAAA